MVRMVRCAVASVVSCLLIGCAGAPPRAPEPEGASSLPSAVGEESPAAKQVNASAPEQGAPAATASHAPAATTSPTIASSSAASAPVPGSSPAVTFSPTAQAGRQLCTEWQGNGMKQLEGFLVDGRRDGVWTSWGSNGFKRWQGRYRDGLLQGTWTWWDDNGSKLQEVDFVADEVRCRRTYQTQAGRSVLLSETHFRDGRRDGPYQGSSGKNQVVRYYSRGVAIPDPDTEPTAPSSIGYRLKHADDPAVRVEAARLLAGIQPPDEGAIEDLLLGLRDPEPRVVRECATTLGIAGARAAAAVEALQHIAAGDDRALAECARRALQRIADDR